MTSPTPDVDTVLEGLRAIMKASLPYAITQPCAEALALIERLRANERDARIWTKVDVIRAKQAAKPRGSPLPQPPTAPTVELTPQLREAMLAGAHELDGSAWINEQYKFLTPAGRLRAHAALLRAAAAAGT